MSAANTGRGYLVRRKSRVSGWALTQDAVSVFPPAGLRTCRLNEPTTSSNRGYQINPYYPPPVKLINTLNY